MRNESEWLEVGPTEARREETLTLLDEPSSLRCYNVLSFALADSDWRVRKDAAEVAGKLSLEHDEVMRLLLEAVVQEQDVALRNAGIEAFAYSGPAAAEGLIQALQRAKPTARKFLAAALAHCGQSGLSALEELSRDADPNTAVVAIEALVLVSGESAVSVLRAHLTSAELLIQLAALEGLSTLNAAIPVAELEPLFGNPILRRSALRLAARSGDFDIIPRLVQLFRDACSEAEEREAIRALSHFAEANPECAELLREAVRELEPEEIRRLIGWVSSGDAETGFAATHILLIAGEHSSLSEIARLASRTELFPPALAALTNFGLEAVPSLLDLESELEPESWAWSLEVAAELTVLGASDVAPAPFPRLCAAVDRASNSVEPIVIGAAARAKELLEALDEPVASEDGESASEEHELASPDPDAPSSERLRRS